MAKRRDWSTVDLTTEPVPVIARRLGVTPQRVYQVMKERGLTPVSARRGRKKATDAGSEVQSAEDVALPLEERPKVAHNFDEDLSDEDASLDIFC